MDANPDFVKPDFEALMRENGPMVYTLAVRLSGNEADGQDLAQETFLKAYQNLARFRGESTVATWLYRICLNVWKNRVRYEKRRSFWRHFSLDATDPEEESPTREIAADESPMGSALEASECQVLVRQALSRLDPEDRAILVLRDMEDKPYEEIADLLSVPLGTVKSRLARSREKLRQIVEGTLKEKQ